ncbi:hypothetical protein BKA58DRAFT_22921 [Alternaria rosae]|uniref:uncharacterized protein n=1 Tax=Alternaria rosae TaxID=1187941 RepID=UPI001E8CB96E|nr:uncharacterized protein BKA58DRAFT_22921 [Alternaria rosae]KAH6882673.1 hypothetical protein BKA58DRAFT_22921 [Alternaria rosae]
MEGAPGSPVNDADTTNFEPHSKRRKLRKGTTSCWHCKKRKVKCTFDATSDTICVACRRRKVPCVLQNQPEEELLGGNDSSREASLLRPSRGSNNIANAPDIPYEQLLSRLQRAEALLARSEYPGDDSTISYVQLPTPNSAALTPEQSLPQTEDSENTSSALRRTFPPQQDLDLLCKSDRNATLYSYQCLTTSVDPSEHDSLDIADDLATIPDTSRIPPVLIARHMLILALMLQYFRCNKSDCISGNPGVLAARLVETVVRLVVTKDHLIGCIEGLECIVYEATFQSNAGNLRRAWIAFRRAMVFAQLMRLDTPNPPPVKYLESKHRVDPKFLWFRIVHMDSYLSLMLGLPHGGQKMSVENSSPGGSVSCQIDRAHTLIACGIVDRNRGDPGQNIEATRKLDRDLQNVAASVPDKYWLTPSFTGFQPNARETFEELMRLRSQIYQYNLLHLLHLPFLIRCSKGSDYYMYAKITCINAAREILTRFVAFHNFRPISTQSCHTADFFALMAGMTILIAHIDSRRWTDQSFLVHQRPGDRAMVEQLVEKLELVETQTNDPLTGKSAEQLRNLLLIESDAARGFSHSSESTVNRLEEGCGEQFQLSIPYFGIIKIGANGITKQRPGSQTSTAAMPDVPSSLNPVGVDDNISSFGQDISGNPSSNLLVPESGPQHPQSIQPPLAPSDEIFNTSQCYPGWAAGTDDWALQGVDAAFFESLMGGVGSWDDTLLGNS